MILVILPSFPAHLQSMRSVLSVGRPQSGFLECPSIHTIPSSPDTSLIKVLQVVLGTE